MYDTIIVGGASAGLTSCLYAGRQGPKALISEEALLFAKYLRDERDSWIPRIAIPVP